MNIEAEDDDDLLNELDHELKNTQTSKVSFKKKSFNKPQKIQRNKLLFNIDDEEEDEEKEGHDGEKNNINELKPVPSKGASLLRFNPRTKFTKEKSSETEQPVKKPINLSRYQIDTKTTTTTDNADQEIIPFELDEEDPENNPVITNIDDLNDEDNEEFAKLKSKLIATTTTSQIFNHSEVLTSANKDTPKRYVPIETNRVPESLKLSIRQYTKALVNEYKDDKNYDDGTERQNQEDQDLLLHDINDGDIELNDEDMGILTIGKRANFDDNKFNFEIHSDDDDEKEESDDRLHSENESNDNGNIDFRIPTVEEQIMKINGLIKQLEVTKSEKQKLVQNLKIERDELTETKLELLEKLNNLVI